MRQRIGVMLCAAAALLTGCQPRTPFAFQDYPHAPSLGADRLHHAATASDSMALGEGAAMQIAAGEMLELSIEQAVMTALRNNRSLRVEQHQPQIVGTFEQIERARFDPEITGEVVIFRERRQQVSPATRDVFDTTAEGQQGAVGIAQEFPSGTAIGLSLSHARTDSDRVPSQHSPRLGLTLTQALLRGANWEANVASIRQAQLETLASTYELRAFAEAVVAQVETTFWEHLLAEREIEIFDRSLDLAQQQLDETQRRVEVGTVAETELAAPRAEVAQRREALINARSNKEQIRLRLLRLINPNAESGWDQQVHLRSPLQTDQGEPEAAEEHLALGRLMRPELNEARLRLEQGRLEVIQTRHGLLPRLDFFLTLGKSGFAETFSRAWRDMDGRGYDLQAGIQFSYPIGNRAAEADYQRARLTRRQALESLHNLEQLVDLDILLAYVDVQRAGEQIAATRATRELREETLRAETEKFRIGTSTGFLVAQAQRDLLESEIAEVRAMVVYRQQLIELYRLEGTLLQRRAIDAPGDRPVRATN